MYNDNIGEQVFFFGDSCGNKVSAHFQTVSKQYAQCTRTESQSVQLQQMPTITNLDRRQTNVH